MSGADPRVSAAREFLVAPGPRHDALLPASVLTRMFYELRRHLGQVLDVLGETAAASHAEDAGALAGIRGVLAAFDWERDDRQYALEHIERIALGDDPAASGADLAPAVLAGNVDLTPAQLATLGQALADAIQYRDPAGACADCEAIPAAAVPGSPGRLAPGLCDDHTEDLNRTDAYLALAAELGIEVDR
jgi:hypothetical protein